MSCSRLHCTRRAPVTTECPSEPPCPLNSLRRIGILRIPRRRAAFARALTNSPQRTTIHRCWLCTYVKIRFFSRCAHWLEPAVVQWALTWACRGRQRVVVRLLRLAADSPRGAARASFWAPVGRCLAVLEAHFQHGAPRRSIRDTLARPSRQVATTSMIRQPQVVARFNITAVEAR